LRGFVIGRCSARCSKAIIGSRWLQRCGFRGKVQQVRGLPVTVVEHGTKVGLR
jgi:hypothetical protein